MENYNLSDIAAVSGGSNAFSGNGLWIFALLLLIFGVNGFGNNKGYMNSDLNTFATAAGQNEVLLGQKFDALSQSVNKVGDGISSLGYSQLQTMSNNTASINGNIVNESRAIQSQLCAINSNIDNKFASLEKSQLEQRIQEQAAQIAALQTQQSICGIPKVNPYMYSVQPTCCGCNNI